jgi:hypothetical protein
MRKLFTPSFKRFLRRALAPREEFVARTETLFLNATRERFGTIPTLVTAQSFWTLPKYATAFATVFIGIGGLSFYAHRSDVAFSNTLYPLKRGYESVRVASVSEEKRPTYHAYFANRRMHELASIATENASTKEVATLASDAQYEIQQVLSSLPPRPVSMMGAQAFTAGEDTMTPTSDSFVSENTLCDSIENIFQSQSPTVITFVASNTAIETGFREKCGTKL